jgi:aromatic ring-cleaving dioxygenase
MRRHDKGLLPDLSFREAWDGGLPVVWAMNRLIRRLKPRQIFNSRFGAMLCYPGDYLVGLWLGGLLTGNMWYQGTRFVDRVVISGDEEAAVCARAGLPVERVAKIGNPVFEALVERVSQRSQIRQQLADRFGIDPLKKIVILSVPSLWEHKMISREEQFAVLEQIVSVLKKHDGAVALSLHPRSRADDYRALADRLTIPLLDRPLMDVLVGADAFVASAYSSTMRWALALGLPAVNLDFWNLDESTYAAYPSYPVVKDLDGLEQWFREALQSPWQGPDRLTIPGHNALGIVTRARFSEGLRQLIDRLVAQPLRVAKAT